MTAAQVSRPILEVDEWKHLEQRGRAPQDVLLRKAFPCEIGGAAEKDSALGPRDIALTISTSSPDRDRDVINADGWKLDSYRKNPVVLWAHDYRSTPIARAKRLTAGQGRLRAVDEFVPKEIDPFAETVFQLLKHKFLSAASVGFRPLKYQRNDERGGYDFIEQELLEHSIVPVPANAEALVEVRSLKGLDLSRFEARRIEGLDLSRLGGPSAWAGFAPDDVISVLTDDSEDLVDVDPDQVRRLVALEVARRRGDPTVIIGGVEMPASELADMIATSAQSALDARLLALTGKLD